MSNSSHISFVLKPLKLCGSIKPCGARLVQKMKSTKKTHREDQCMCMIENQWNVANMRSWKRGVRGSASFEASSDHRRLVGAAAPRHGGCLVCTRPRHPPLGPRLRPWQMEAKRGRAAVHVAIACAGVLGVDVKVVAGSRLVLLPALQWMPKNCSATPHPRRGKWPRRFSLASHDRLDWRRACVAVLASPRHRFWPVTRAARSGLDFK